MSARHKNDGIRTAGKFYEQTDFPKCMEAADGIGWGNQMRADHNFSATRTFSHRSSLLWQLETNVSDQDRLDPTVWWVILMCSKTWHLENYWTAINGLFHAPQFCPQMQEEDTCHYRLWVTRGLPQSERVLQYRNKKWTWSKCICQSLRCWATNRKVAGSIPDGVIGIFHWHNPRDRTMALGSTQPLTEMSTRRISWG